MKTLLKSLLLLIGGAALMAFLIGNPFSWRALDGFGSRFGPTTQAAAEEPEEGTLWTCGMHPQVISETPGSCPICHMDLVPMGATAEGGSMDAAAAAPPKWICPVHAQWISEDEPGTCPICGRSLVQDEPHDHEAGSDGWWTCPMHPEIVQDEPGSCPICGMDLVYKEAERGAQTAPAAGSGVEVRIEPGLIQAMNVRTEPSTRGDIVQHLRTLGAFAYDESGMVTVTTKFQGYIEGVRVSHVGQKVRRGQSLFEIYSSELVQTQSELLSALDYSRRLEAGGGDAARRAAGLVEAARQRLRYWDIGARQIRRIEERGAPLRTLTVTSPLTGIVMKRPSGLEGLAVKPGMEILHLADLTNLWLETEIYEDQLAWIDVGTQARVSVEAFPELELTGTVAFLDPAVSEKTRTVPVTLRIANPDERLRVGMWAAVEFDTTLARDAVLVPSEAVLRTGERNVVVVALGGGRFVPREVQLGPEGNGRVAIRSGLEAGETIVTSSQFLIDSESTLREAVRKMVADRRGRN